MAQPELIKDIFLKVDQSYTDTLNNINLIPGSYALANYTDSSSPLSGIFGTLIQGAGIYKPQIVFGTTASSDVNRIFIRRYKTDSSSYTSWHELITSNNFSGFLDGRYVLKSGDIMTGNLIVPYLTVLPQDNQYEGGEIELRPSTSDYSVVIIDLYQNYFRLHDGSIERFRLDMTNGNITFRGLLQNNFRLISNESVASGTTAGLRNTLLIFGETYGNDTAYIKTAGKLSLGDPGPQIMFNTQNSLTSGQRLALIYTDHDSIGSGNGLSLVSSESNAWFIAPTIKALTKFIGNLEGNANSATIANAITNLSSNDNASSSTTWRKVWFSWEDGVTGRPALTDNLVFQNSSGTLKAPIFLSTNNITIQRSTSISSNNPAAINFKVIQTDNNLTSSAYIAVYDDHDANNYGTNMVISSGGNIIIGSGESPNACYSNDLKDSSSENMYITSDNNIYFYTNCQTYANKKTSCYISTAGVLYGAAWNDYAEYRSSDPIEPGRVICETGNGTLKLSTERLQPGANIVSDTFGFAIGETENCKTPIAVSGRALVYTYEDRYSYEAGDPVCAGPGGTVSKMSREEVMMYPDRIVGIVSEIPEYERWGTGNVEVKNRIWIKVK